MKHNAKLQDAGAERAVLAGLMQHGIDGMAEVDDILSANDFYNPINQKLFAIIKHLINDKSVQTLDLPTMLSGAKVLGYDDFAGAGREEEYLRSIMDEQIAASNVRKLASVVAKLHIARQAWVCLNATSSGILQLTGNETVDQILAAIEDPVFDFTSKLASTETSLVQIGDNFEAIMKEILSNKKDIVGLPTGFPKWDFAIGGGQRSGTVNIIGARPKVGKSTILLNMAHNMAAAGIQVLYLDTEMTRPFQMMKLTAIMSGVEVNNLETGKFGNNQAERQAVYDIYKNLKALPLTHCSIAGMPIQEVLSMCRRWLTKTVGAKDGKRNPCVIIYDYLKLMDTGEIKHNIAEYQVLGFMLTQMHNFALKFLIPFLAAVQLNRDGIEKEGGEVVAGSDRILWLASSVTILKKKTQDDLNEDPPINGERKMIVTDTRFGPGMEIGDYINVKSDLTRARMEEGKSYSQGLATTLKVGDLKT